MENQLSDLPLLGKRVITKAEPVQNPSSCCTPKLVNQSTDDVVCCTPSQAPEENDGACCAQPVDGSACCSK